MVVSSQQQPRSTGPSGYRPLLPPEFGKAAGHSAYAFMGIAAGMGLLLGVGIALAVRHPKVTAAPHVSNAVSALPSGLSALPASYTGPASSLLSVIDIQNKANAATPDFAKTHDKSGKKHAAAHKRNGLLKLWPFKKESAKRTPYVSPNAPTTPAEPTALDLAIAAAATGPFVLAIQGDATVAGYDVATGTVETYEGSSFVLDKPGESGAIPWDDFPFHVHYRCDKDSNCTMIHGGATAAARLAR